MKKIIAIFFVVFTVCINAQPPGGGPPAGGPPAGGPTGGTPPCWTPDCIPVDGGTGFLIAAGIALGFREIKKRRQKSK